MEQNPQTVISYNFSVAFEQMCVMASVAQTRNSEETLQELILYCFTRFPDEKFTSLDEIHDAVLVMSGLDFPKHEIESSVDTLIIKGNLKNNKGEFRVPSSFRLELIKNVEEAESLEKNVKAEWFKEVSEESPLIEFEDLWRALRSYLALAFRRHGIQTVSLLDPSIKIGLNSLDNLSTMLDSAVSAFDDEHRETARKLISSFMATVGKSFYRTKYITQIADGAFNYFSLAIIPEIAENFRKNLVPLTLFLDTNFLYGILDLTINPQVAVSIELMNAIEKYHLPFQLRYHERTEVELLRSISGYRQFLRQTSWPQNLSRGIQKTRSLSGVELRYHQRNAIEIIDVDTYFQPYEHSDIILTEKNIIKYVPTDDRTQEISALSCNYSEYLEAKKHDKPNPLIDHDVTVLDTVKSLRTQSKNTLEAGALLITCDYSLYGFDWETSRKNNSMPCTVLPNLFWQLIRPFIPADGNFDRSFAETFAVPEFRLIGSNASVTASRMASILASYKGMSEELAVKLLSNDILIKKLRDYLIDEVSFKEKIENAIVQEHETLEEEFSLLQGKLEETKSANVKLSEAYTKVDNELNEKVKIEFQLRERIDTLLANEQIVQEQSRVSEGKFEKEKTELESNLRIERENRKNYNKIYLASALSLILLIIFETLSYSLHWIWFINHPRVLGLQGSIFILVPAVMFLLFIPKWRKSTLVGIIISMIIGVFSLIDGV
jgi:hypothetical protein